MQVVFSDHTPISDVTAGGGFQLWRTMENTCCDITAQIWLWPEVQYALKISVHREQSRSTMNSTPANSLWIQLKALNTVWFESNVQESWIISRYSVIMSSNGQT